MHSSDVRLQAPRTVAASILPCKSNQRSTRLTAPAAFKVQQANVEAQRARVTGRTGPALYLAKLFGTEDTESVVRQITALLVLVLNPLAVLLTLAALAMSECFRGRVFGG
jgi:hypothetical protein